MNTLSCQILVVSDVHSIAGSSPNHHLNIHTQLRALLSEYIIVFVFVCVCVTISNKPLLSFSFFLSPLSLFFPLAFLPFFISSLSPSLFRLFSFSLFPSLSLSLSHFLSLPLSFPPSLSLSHFPLSLFPSLPPSLLLYSYRLGALSSLDEEIDPTSTRPEDVKAFRKCVAKYQQSTRLGCPCRGGGADVEKLGVAWKSGGGGVLCPHTIAMISEQIRFFRDQDLQQV